mmetsp:Transcript_56124/g.162568  ORF Transcript_56124/g.162568 Transcript_56124/m.162568 type:complete len:421 (+) Transcript_56124:64-1326(+)|eukprot:CAMPEP_0176087012 /NCGR_PEP_ID=MMETSP0120_2-20121206/43558_1 /TAXON_ID=160619 /ORGANISM="Kryptoperidinium foliaceum, Strain CCMP 1326" /LENGTH=420 /DNA_ID=CAMNT_0017420849 /DNA_START=1 /DNA_END=1263 /DNA_ORIENTATION=-
MEHAGWRAIGLALAISCLSIAAWGSHEGAIENLWRLGGQAEHPLRHDHPQRLRRQEPATSRRLANETSAFMTVSTELHFDRSIWLTRVVPPFLIGVGVFSLRQKTLPRTAYFKQAFFVLATCLTYMIVGPALTLLNKHVMDHHGFTYPLSLSGLGVLASAVFSRLVVAGGLATVRPESLKAVEGSKWLRVALPVGACKALSLALGNAVYLHLGVGFIQMLKAFTPAIVLAVMVCIGNKRPSRGTVFWVFVIVVGTVLEVNGELHATVLGLVLIFFSEVFEAVNLVLMQLLLQDSKFSLIEGMYVLAPPGALCLVSAAAVLEWRDMWSSGRYTIILENPWDFLGASTLGLAVNFVTMFLVQLTSSVFTKVLNTFRCICLVIVGVIVYGEAVSVVELVGYGIALIGFAGYNYEQLVTPEAKA